MTEIQLMVALAELLKQGGLLALVIIEAFIIRKMYYSRDELYDRLIKSKEEDRKRSDDMVERVVTALGRATAVAERIESKKYGVLEEQARILLAEHVSKNAEDDSKDSAASGRK